MSTFMATAQSVAGNSRWHLIDAGGQVLGRVATTAARLLQGKHKPTYTPFIDTGDFVASSTRRRLLTARRRSEALSPAPGLKALKENALVRSARAPVEEAAHTPLKTKMGEAMYRSSAALVRITAPSGTHRSRSQRQQRHYGTGAGNLHRRRSPPVAAWRSTIEPDASSPRSPDRQLLD
jgi:large subunit ribosomal protein L13